MDGTEQFTRWFQRATAFPPYAYQRTLAETPPPPDVLHLPTGSGKTQALIGAWLFQRQAARAPRRLVYALPMRSLVEQTAHVAIEMRRRLGLEHTDLPIHVLMGGEPPFQQDWRMRPEADQILIGTIDMLLSRALNRGFAEGRFAWPVAFGLLSADCRWIFDEVQLMGPARATSAQLDGLRGAFGTALPCEKIWVSATVDRNALETVDRPDLGSVMSLPAEDRNGGLARRLEARKVLERVDTSAAKGQAFAHSTAELALERHVAGTRTLVVLNTVQRAQETFGQLRRLTAGEGNRKSVLLHSRFRPPDRKARMDEMLAEPDGEGSIVVATQVVEAGVDMSARTLVTEPAPFSSIVQRLGRCNREGEYSEATALWLDTGPVDDDAAGRSAAAPYPAPDVDRTRSALLELEGCSLSPAALERIDGPQETADDPAVLRRRDLVDLFDTSPDLSGMDIDIAPFIREDDERNVTVVFRDLPADPPARIPGEAEPQPQPDELVQVPRLSLRGRTCWVIEHVDGEWIRRPARDIAPGATVMLRSSDGGYTAELGWDGKAREPVSAIALEDPSAVQGYGSDATSESRTPQELSDHLSEVASEVAALADTLGLDEWRDALHAAGSLHDVGKAHPVFQATLRSTIDLQRHPDRDERLWAKSGGRGRRHERRYFRHELASALALSALDGELGVPRRDLTTYLVAAHHGKVRLSIRPAPDEERPSGVDDDARFALGVVEGDLLPEVETPIGTIPSVMLSLAAMELGADPSWTDAAIRLRDDHDLGPFRLALLEAVLRIADWRASG